MSVLIRRGPAASIPTLAVGELGLATDTGQVYVGTATGNELVGGSVADGDKGDITVSGGGATWTIDASVVTFAKMQAVSANVLLGNDASGTTVEEIACTAAARTVLDDATVGDMVNTLGGASSTGTGGLVRATSPTLVTPLLGTPTSGTLTNCTGLPQAGTVGLTTADSPQFAAVNLSHASANTLTGSGGDAFVEGNLLYRAGGTDVAVADGGTNLSSYSQGDILYASAGTTLSVLAKDTNATRYLSNTGSSNNPAWAQVNMANGVTGTLPSANGGTTSTVGLPTICDGRLTLTTGVPVTTSDVTGAGTIYFTPYIGSQVALYDGSKWALHTFTERSLALTLTSGKNYDVFLYNDSGTLTLELSNAWSTDSARADALTTQDGVYVKSGATTRRYLGTIRASGSNTTEDSTSRRFVWNYYHRVRRHLVANDTTNSWTYTTATWRQANNSTTVGTARVEVLCGFSEDLVTAEYNAMAYNTTACAASPGVGINSTSVNSAQTYAGNPGTVVYAPIRAAYRGYPGQGYAYIQALEISQATGTTNWAGDIGSTNVQTGLLAEVMA